MSISIKWKGPSLDPSGYGTANRDYIDALYRVGVDITVQPWNFEAKSASFYGKQGELVESLKNRNIDYDVVVHHYVPNNIVPEEGKFNVGYNTWETDSLPDHWVEKMNESFDLVLVPSNFNKQVYKNSGVKTPIEVVPHCVDVSEFKNAEPARIPGYENRYKFFSVFQWIERKNPVGLLKAYFTGFYNRDDVLLVLKTYGSNTSTDQRNKIKQMIDNLKKDLRLDPNKLPPIYFLGDLLTRDIMTSVYKACDCFVLPTRGEGFGIPFAEALAADMQVVAPKQGGQLDILEPQELTGYLPCGGQWTPVSHMPWIPNYNGLMNWFDPNILEFRDQMIKAAEMKTPHTIVQPSKHIANNFNHETIGNLFIHSIEKHM